MVLQNTSLMIIQPGNGNSAFLTTLDGVQKETYRESLDRPNYSSLRIPPMSLSILLQVDPYSNKATSSNKESQKLFRNHWGTGARLISRRIQVWSSHRSHKMNYPWFLSHRLWDLLALQISAREKNSSPGLKKRSRSLKTQTRVFIKGRLMSKRLILWRKRASNSVLPLQSEEWDLAFDQSKQVNPNNCWAFKVVMNQRNQLKIPPRNKISNFTTFPKRGASPISKTCCSNTYRSASQTNRIMIPWWPMNKRM